MSAANLLMADLLSIYCPAENKLITKKKTIINAVIAVNNTASNVEKFIRLIKHSGSSIWFILVLSSSLIQKEEITTKT
ncbi:hypothetical protein GCM10011379_32700 [Filimonas zeae]|uniref:Uncharacterized protein n=1 Tax=Filimonas zeae TaxID=1737353 RepID=A0A917J2P4_9BACT|nr:hypothetical protein GCM10011379_32700 [Filimonas zeae]